MLRFGWNHKAALALHSVLSQHGCAHIRTFLRRRPRLPDAVPSHLERVHYVDQQCLLRGFFTDFLFCDDYDGCYDLRYGFFSLPVGVLVQWRFSLFELLSVYANLGGGIWPWFFRDDHYYRGGGTLIRGLPLFALGANLAAMLCQRGAAVKCRATP